MNVSSIQYLHYITTVKSQSDNLFKFKKNVLSKLIRDEESERVMVVLYISDISLGNIGLDDSFLSLVNDHKLKKVSFHSAPCFIEVGKQLELLPSVVFVYLKSICHPAEKRNLGCVVRL